MSHYVESRVVDRPEGEHAVVEIHQVGVVVVYHVDGAVEEVVVVLLRGYGSAFGPVPDVPCVAAERVVLHVQFLRVVAFPPFAFAVFFCHNACVVRYSGIRAGLVCSLRCFIPRPRVRGVYAHAEGQAVFTGSLLPFGKYVAFRTHVYRVPALVLAVPEVHIVVVVAHGEKVLCADALVERNEFFGIPVLGFPFVDYVHKAELRRVAVQFDMALVGIAAFFVHGAAIPVAGLGLALRAPVGPNAEFGVAEPFGRFICRERFPCGLELSAFGGFALGYGRCRQ